VFLSFIPIHFSLDCQVEDQIKIAQFSAGVDISMAVSTKGEVFGWGKSRGGRIGLDSNDFDVTLPRRVPLDVKAVDVECGYVHSVIVGVDGTIHMCGGVGIDGLDDGQQELNEKGQGKYYKWRKGSLSFYCDLDLSNITPLLVLSVLELPVQVHDFNVWHRVPEPKARVSTKRWKKYGKYELQGRSKVMAEAARWGA